jgi:hypothetical protein
MDHLHTLHLFQRLIDTVTPSQLQKSKSIIGKLILLHETDTPIIRTTPIYFVF